MRIKHNNGHPLEQRGIRLWKLERKPVYLERITERGGMLPVLFRKEEQKALLAMQKIKPMPP